MDADISRAVRHGRLDPWRHRFLLASLIVRDLKVKYKRSVLGFLWTLLNPLTTVAILIAVFTHIFRMPIEDYWAFVLSGFFVWNFLQQVMGSSTSILAEHAALGRSIAFPKEVLILSLALSRLVEFVAGLALVVAALAVFHHGALPASLALLPLLLVLQLLLALGLQFPIATMAVFFHDVQHALPIVLFSLFYISPVFYPVSFVPEAVRDAYMLNPIAQLLSLYQTVLYEGQVPSAEMLGLSCVTISIVAVVGYAIFARYKHLFAEVL